jgi:hypothetical protein
VRQPELANAGAEPRYVAEIDAMTSADLNLGNQSVHRMHLPTLEAHGSRSTLLLSWGYTVLSRIRETTEPILLR